MGTYALSWLGVNWQIWVYAFERTPAQAKIQAITSVIWGVWPLGAPLGITAFVVLAVPFLQAGVSRVVSIARQKQLDWELGLRRTQTAIQREELHQERLHLERTREALASELRSLTKEKEEWSSKEKQRLAREQEHLQRMEALTRRGDELATGVKERESLVRELPELKQLHTRLYSLLGTAQQRLKNVANVNPHEARRIVNELAELVKR